MNIKNTIAYIVARVLPAAISMFTVYFYTNNVDPLQYGIYSKITGLSSVLYPMIFAPLWYYIIRYRIQDGKKIENQVYSAFWLIVGVGTLVCLLCSSILEGKMYEELVGTIFMILLFGNIQIQLESFRVTGYRIRYLVLATSRSIIILFLSYILVRNNISIVVSPIVDSTLFGILICVLPVNIGSIRWTSIASSFVSLRAIYKFGFLLGAYSVFNTAIFTIDRVLIAYINSDYDAGLYSSAYDLATKTVHTLVFALELSMLPTLLNTKYENKDIGSQIFTNTKVYIFFMLPLVVGLLSISPAVYKIYFPLAYREAAEFVFPLVVLATFFGGFANAIYHHSYLLADDHSTLLKTIFLALLLNIVLNVLVDTIGMPFYSSCISLLTFICYTIITYIYSKKTFFIKFPTQFTFLVAIQCLPMCIYAIIRGYSASIQTLIIEVFITVLVYVLTCYFFNVMNTRLFINKFFIRSAQ